MASSARKRFVFLLSPWARSRTSQEISSKKDDLLYFFTPSTPPAPAASVFCVRFRPSISFASSFSCGASDEPHQAIHLAASPNDHTALLEAKKPRQTFPGNAVHDRVAHKRSFRLNTRIKNQENRMPPGNRSQKRSSALVHPICELMSTNIHVQDPLKRCAAQAVR